MSRETVWKETLDANHCESDGNHNAIRHLDGVHVELRDVLKELGLAKRLD